MELERGYRVNLSNIMNVKRGSDGSCSIKLEKSGIDFINLTDEDSEDESKKLDWKKLMIDLGDSEGSNERSDDFKQVKSETSSCNDISSDGSDNRRFSASPILADDIVKNSENSCDSRKCSTKDDEEEELMMNVDSGVSKEVSSRKRKRDCFSGMLWWMANVAKDPTDPVIGEIPESSMWALYGNDTSWKQALLARETLFLKKIRNHNADRFGCQKKQKMHPSLFDDTENLSTCTSCPNESNPPRPRQRLEARLDMQPTASIYSSRPQQRIPVGKAFQAQVPEWTGVSLKSDPKWLGTTTWPLKNPGNKPLIEREDPPGKGRTDNCGCQFPGSIKCVKSHVTERRMKTRFELGSAFYAWNFSRMGEDCSVSWTIEEEKIFRNVIMENPKSSLKCFWEPMWKALPQKRWSDQVNYYYNVFMLERRSYQNRHYPSDVDSDDDETEYGPTSNSIKYGTA